MARLTKIYVAIGGWNYEGHDTPIGVYSTKKLAELAIKHTCVSYSFKFVEEYVLNDLPKMRKGQL